MTKQSREATGTRLSYERLAADVVGDDADAATTYAREHATFDDIVLALLLLLLIEIVQVLGELRELRRRHKNCTHAHRR